MPPASQRRTVLNWIRPTTAERYEIYSELGLPRAVLTIHSPVLAVLESRLGMYLIERKSGLSGAITISDPGGSPIATVRTGWWGRRFLLFHDGRELQFVSSGLFRSRWLWRGNGGEAQAVVQYGQIFFSPEWPIREGLSALLTGLSIYLITNRSSFFNRFMV
ncbi:hypothetical protein GCM10027347_25440 [Larkinella harenae]